MATSVRLRDDDKALLAELQARFELAHKRRVALDEVLHRVLAYARDHVDEMLERDRPPKFTPEEIERILSLPMSFGKRTDPSTIDADVYGFGR